VNALRCCFAAKAVFCFLPSHAVLSLPQQLRQLEDVRRNPPRLIALPTSYGGLIAPAAWRYSPQSAAPCCAGVMLITKLNGMFDADHRNHFLPHPSVSYHFLRPGLDLASWP